MKRLKVYVGCALNDAPKTFVRDIHKLKDILREDYEVLDFIGLNYKTAIDVYKWDIEKCVMGCDFFVAICDYASTGLGFELAEAARLKVPTLVLAKHTKKVSGLLLGAIDLKPSLSLSRYENLLKEVPEIIRTHLKSNPAMV